MVQQAFRKAMTRHILIPVHIFFILGCQIAPSEDSRTHVLKFLARTLCLFLFSAHRLTMVYICNKFHENILNSIKVMERTRKANGPTDRRLDRRKDRWTDGVHDIIQPVLDRRIKKVIIMQKFRFFDAVMCLVES